MRPVRVWYSPEVARWEIERGATELVDGSAVRTTTAGEEWLIGEILSYRGEAVVLEPDLRKRVVARAKELARELGVSRVTAAAR
jgi:predicted DNA-binding transcriptional regulator YafY